MRIHLLGTQQHHFLIVAFLSGNLSGLRCVEQSGKWLFHHCCSLRQRAWSVPAWQCEVGTHYFGQGLVGPHLLLVASYSHRCKPCHCLSVLCLCWFGKTSETRSNRFFTLRKQLNLAQTGVRRVQFLHWRVPKCAINEPAPCEAQKFIAEKIGAKEGSKWLGIIISERSSRWHSKGWTWVRHLQPTKTIPSSTKDRKITNLAIWTGISEKEEGFQNASRCNKHFRIDFVERSMVLDVSPGGLVAWRVGFT